MTRMNRTDNMLRERSQTRTHKHAVGDLYLYEVQGQAKLIYHDRSQNRSHFWEGLWLGEGTGTFLGAGNALLMWAMVAKVYTYVKIQ